MKKSLFKTGIGLLASATLVSLIGLGTRQEVSAVTHTVTYDNGLYWATFASNNSTNYTENGNEVEWPMGLAVYSINGQWTFCIEPSIPTNAGSTGYTSGTLRQYSTTRRYFNKSGQLVQTVLSGDPFYQAAYMPYVLLEMSPSDIAAASEALGRSQEEIRGITDFLGWLRGLEPEYRYNFVQLLYWNNTGGYHFVRARPHDNPYRATQPKADEMQRNWVSKSNGKVNYTWAHQTVNNVRDALQAGILEESQSATIYSTENNHNWVGEWGVSKSIYQGINAPGQQFTESGKVRLAMGYVKPVKQSATLNSSTGINKTPENHRSYDWNGVQVGLYSDAALTRRIHVFTLNSQGTAEAFRVRQGTYYMAELDSNGSPIRTANSKVTRDERFFRSGVWENGAPVVAVNVTSRNLTPTTAATKTLNNVPVLFGFDLQKTANKTGQLLMEQNSSQYSLQGAQYQLFYSRSTNDPVLRTNGQPVIATVGSNGIASFRNLPNGRYYYREVKTPNGTINNQEMYDLNTEFKAVDLNSIDVTANANDTSAINSTMPVLSIKDRDTEYSENEALPNKWPVVTKVDSQTNQNQPQGIQATFAGAEFEVTFKGQLNGRDRVLRYRTDENGEFDIGKASYLTNRSQIQSKYIDSEGKIIMPSSAIEIREVKAPDGYIKSDEVIRLTEDQVYSHVLSRKEIQIGSDLNFSETRLDLNLVKKQEDDATGATMPVLPGAVFNLKRTDGKSYSEDQTTDASGKLSFKGLAPGKYVLTEKEAPTGYYRNKQEITFTINEDRSITTTSTSNMTREDGSYTIEWGHERVATNGLKGSIDSNVADQPIHADLQVLKANEKGQKLEGAEFTLINETKGTDPKVLTTDAEGRIHVEDELDTGDWFTIEETKAPAGYKLPSVRRKVRFRIINIPVQDVFKIEYSITDTDVYLESDHKTTTTEVKTISQANQTQDGITFTGDKTDREVSFELVNNTWMQLPETGSTSMLLVAGGVTAMLALGGGATLYIKRKEESEDVTYI